MGPNRGGCSSCQPLRLLGKTFGLDGGGSGGDDDGDSSTETWRKSMVLKTSFVATCHNSMDNFVTQRPRRTHAKKQKIRKRKTFV